MSAAGGTDAFRSRCATAPCAGRRGARSALHATWSDPPGMARQLARIEPQDHRPAIHHHDLRVFLLGGVLALVMRLATRAARAALVRPELYNQLFTMHGTTMMFLFAVPVMQAVATCTSCR
jgi:cytochrome c oxidase subunit I+III